VALRAFEEWANATKSFNRLPKGRKVIKNKHGKRKMNGGLATYCCAVQKKAPKVG